VLLSSDESELAEILQQQLAGLSAGAHVSPFYDTPAERMRALVPYFQAGLAQGEQCLYIADDASVDDLRAHGIGSDEDLARATVVVLTPRETYLRNGRFDSDEMFELLVERQAAARAAGFAGLRVAAEMSWALEPDIDSERLIEHEARLNEFLPATGIRVMCQYDSRRFPAGVLRDVLRTHPLAILGEHMHDNPYFEPPALVLGGAEVDGQRIAWMRQRLEARTRRELAVADLGQLALVGAPPSELTDAAARLVAAEIGLEFVQVYELPPAGDALFLVAAVSPPGFGPGRVEPILTNSPLANGEFGAGQPVIIPDWTHEMRFEPGSVARPPDVSSSAFVVTNLGQGKRVLGVHSREPRLFSSNEILFLETVAIMLAHAIERRRSEDRFHTLVENAPDPIVRRNREFRIEYVNPAVERTTGTPAESLIGKTSSDLGILESLVPTWELLLRQVWRTGREQTFELTVRTPMGERVFDSRIVPESGPDGSVQSLLTISRDVSEQRRAEADRAALYQQLVAQQNQVQELMSRLAQDSERSRGRNPAASLLEHLSDRQRHILCLLTAGMTNREIAAEVGLTTGSVKNHVARLLSNLNVTDRTQAAVRAVELGLVHGAEPSRASRNGDTLIH
jgi:PAS domain S-box-containing protein